MTRVIITDNLAVGFTFQHDLGFGTEIGIKGVTQCILHVTDTTPLLKDPGALILPYIYNGSACCSAKDDWDKNKGRKVALGRALKMAGLDRTQRSAVWARYHARKFTNAEYAAAQKAA